MGKRDAEAWGWSLQTSVLGKESVGTQDKESSVLLISYSKNEQS